eukprot:c14401_g1_i2.p1 GENE.c14401_g1_i2~~c14401_g1_i2.p1  ORF type:complete len:182 (-),score=33.88 c14401_g1_i2:262-807(-)
MLALGRVSVIRGEGPNEGMAIIDDYIATTEPVADHLTRWSGLSAGDLDVRSSKHHIVSLKTAYIKLRYLIDCGCKFVGHGLNTDFRIINIFVDSDHVIDTVNIFCQPRNRKLSLRFLAYHLLNLNIQSETHDSVEDARTALALYRKYGQLKAEGIFEQTLENLYSIGVTNGWDVPDPESKA